MKNTLCSTQRAKCAASKGSQCTRIPRLPRSQCAPRRQPLRTETGVIIRLGCGRTKAMPLSFAKSADSQKLWGSLSGCGPAFLRVQPAGKPAAGKIARPTICAKHCRSGKLSGIGRTRGRHKALKHGYITVPGRMPVCSPLDFCLSSPDQKLVEYRLELVSGEAIPARRKRTAFHSAHNRRQYVRPGLSLLSCLAEIWYGNGTLLPGPEVGFVSI